MKRSNMFKMYLSVHLKEIWFQIEAPCIKVVMRGKLFQRCTHLLYCSVLSLGGNVNTRRMSKPDMGSIFHKKKSMKYFGHRKLLCELSKLSKLSEFNAFDPLGYQTNNNASIIVYKFCPERTGFSMYAECTQLQLTFLVLHPCPV